MAEIILRLLDLGTGSPIENGIVGWLSGAEHDYAKTISLQDRQTRWIGGRALLRRSLWECIGDTQLNCEFKRLPSGQLHADGCPVYFSSAHTGSWVAVAVCTDAPVGVDIEPRQRRIVDLAMWSRFLSDAELQYANGETERFLRLWVCKESVVKADGRGFFSFGPRSVKLRVLPNDDIALDEGTQFGACEKWRLASGISEVLRWAVAARTAEPLEVDTNILVPQDFPDIHGKEFGAQLQSGA